MNNNRFAYSTPNALEFAVPTIAERASAYGIPGARVDGGEVLEVYDAARTAVERARDGGGPTLIESVSLRWRGHAGHDPAKYMPPEMLEDAMANHDPVKNFEGWMRAHGLLDDAGLEALQTRIEREFEEGYAYALASPFPEAQDAFKGNWTDDGYWTSEPGRDGGTEAVVMATAKVEAGAAGHGAEPRGKRTDDGQATYLIAIAEALWEEMERDDRVYLLGEDIGAYGGAFKVTEGFLDRFGAARVMDTPIAEETIVGMAVGSAMEGFRPVAEFQYADFMSSGFDEITTVLSRYHYRSGVPLPVVLRGPSGGGVRASSFHSTNPEPWYAHAGGIKVICPAFPADAKGLLKSAIRDDNPVLFLEHKWIYRRIKEQVPEEPDFLIPIGEANVRREGSDVSVITYGAMVHKALEAAATLAERGISVEVVDLRTVYPLDEDAVLRSIEKTSRALVLSESYRYAGIGAEVAATIAEKAFEHLDAPVERLSPPNLPVPFSPTLEDAFLPQVADIEAAVDRLAAW